MAYSIFAIIVVEQREFPGAVGIDVSVIDIQMIFFGGLSYERTK